jgi:hypothetical protein
MHQQKLLKVILSVFIVFQLTCVFVLPNPDSIIYRELAPLVVTYGNFFDFNTTWRFFSPNPMVRLMEYDVFTPGPDGKLITESFRYPKSLEDEGSRENFNRKLNNAMYMMGRAEFLKDIFGPTICSWHPKADSIAVYMRGRVLPTIEKSKLTGGERIELGEVERQYVADINCKSDVRHE